MIRAALLLLAAESGAIAQGRFELQTFAGYRFGGTFRSSPGDPPPVALRRAPAAGASFLCRISPILSAEAMWKLSPTTAAGPGTTSRVTLNELLGNLLLDLWPAKREDQLQTFLIAGIGLGSFRGADLGDPRYAAGLGGGVKWFPSFRAGLRLQIVYAAAEVYSAATASAEKKSTTWARRRSPSAGSGASGSYCANCRSTYGRMPPLR